MGKMLAVNLTGPYALLPNAENVPLLLANAEAWLGGLYLWTFLHNRAHRIHFVGVCNHSIAERHNDHLADFFAGRRTFYRAEALAGGSLFPAYRPEDGSDCFVAEFPALMNELTRLRVFFALVSAPDTALERIGSGIVAHLQRLGGRAAEWLDNEATSYDADHFAERLTLRFRRPEFIASLPDEMHL
jgi:hypothetical protein